MDIKTKLRTTKKFDRDLVAIHKIKTTLTPNKPAYLRMCLLKLSKLSIYEFHHDYIKNKQGNKLRLFFTNTDSLVSEFELNMLR